MEQTHASLSAWQLVMQSDFLSKLILIVLFSISVVCVAIVIAKLVYFYREKKHLNKLVQDCREIEKLENLNLLEKKYENTLAGSLVKQSRLAFLDALKHKDENVFSKHDLERLELSISQEIDDILFKCEEFLPFLGTSAAVAPLVGLFGTVWGLIHAFINISQEHSADIVVVAPGIAEALTTTLAGLIVAIPAMIFFHYFSNKLRKIDQQLTSCADKFLSLASKAYLK